MRGWRVGAPGEPAEVLHLGELPDPEPTGAAPVVVDVHACGVNFADALLCRGEYQQRPPLPFTPGVEVAGVVAHAPPDSGLEVGRAVVGAPALPAGGYATRCLARPGDLFALPPTVDAPTAAAVHVTHTTAWVALHHRARLSAGETVLVHAAAGATGAAALAVAHAAGARTIATAGGAAKVARCLELGASVAIDHRSEDVVAAVRAATGGAGADVVIDPVGGPTTEHSRRCLAFEGRLVVLGFASGTIPQLPANHLMVKNYDVLGVQWPAYPQQRPAVARRAHDAVMASVASGAIAPEVTRRPLDDAAAALTELAAGRTTGKTVLVVEGDRAR